MLETNTPIGMEARQTWNRARRAAFWARLRENVGNKNTTLLDFNEVSHRLKLRNAVYRGTQVVPLDKIVGSMGRYQDFSRKFLPMRNNLGHRWRDVAALALDTNSRGLPPIEVYKAGEWYFVRDGNHRCSVARMLKQNSIEAYVWEYTDALPEYQPGDNIEKLLIEAERHEFLAQTNLDIVRPGHDIHLTSPGGYTDLLVQIANYQAVLSQIDNIPTAYEEAVTAWYDMIYESAVQLIKDSGILGLFPSSTAADFFIWTTTYEASLKKHESQHSGVEDATRAYKRQHSLLASLARGWRVVFKLVVIMVGDLLPFTQRKRENPVNNPRP